MAERRSPTRRKATQRASAASGSSKGETADALVAKQFDALAGSKCFLDLCSFLRWEAMRGGAKICLTARLFGSIKARVDVYLSEGSARKIRHAVRRWPGLHIHEMAADRPQGKPVNNHELETD